MDDRLSAALEFANYRQTLSNQLQKLKIKTEDMLTVSFNGGTFSIDRDLISFLDYTVRSGRTTIILIDNNGLPIKIDDIVKFLENITNIYNSVTEDYYLEYQQIRKSRNVKSILSIENNE